MTADDVWHKKENFRGQWLMYDMVRVEGLMHDVRMQIVNVFRWACLGVGGVREVGAIQGSVFFCSQD